jgi:4-hydroxy-4-methyl-2-oxoglutarate aldolase
MIEDPPLLTIRRDFPRPSEELIAAFAGVPTGNVVDTMGGLGCLDCRIKPLVQSSQVMVGTAVTCYTGPSDNLALFGALHAAKRGASSPRRTLSRLPQSPAIWCWAWPTIAA